MRISIIVPTLNEAREIGRTIQTLQQLLGDKEILVADGGSTDATLRIAEELGGRVIRAPQGRGQQMRTAASEATGDVFWFVHADTLPPANALVEIETALENSHVAGGNFGLVFDGESSAARRLTAIYPILRHLRLCYGDSGIFVRRSVYEELGGFRPLALFEDLDLLKRIRRRGRFVHLECRMVSSSRRFEQRNFATMWVQWITLQVLYWCGVPPNLLARAYRHRRRQG